MDQFEKEIQQYKVKIKERREQIALLAKSKKKETDISFDNPFAEDEEREKEEAERAKLEDQDKHELKEFLSRFHNSFLALFLKFCNSYELLFVAKPELTPSSKSQATKQLYDFGRGLFDRYLLLVTVRILVLLHLPSLKGHKQDTNCKIWPPHTVTKSNAREVQRT